MSRNCRSHTRSSKPTVSWKKRKQATQRRQVQKASKKKTTTRRRKSSSSANERRRKRQVQPRRPRVTVPQFGRFLERFGFSTLAEEVYQRCRTTQRNRVWTFSRLALAWMLIALSAAESLTAFLRQCRDGLYASCLQVQSSVEAFTCKSASLPPTMMGALVNAFLTSLLESAPPTRGEDKHLKSVHRRFHVINLDGSRLDRIRKITTFLRGVKETVLGGQLTIAYDLRRGGVCHLDFSLDAARAEKTAADALLADLPDGTLLVVDRLYATPNFCWNARAHDVHVLARRWASVQMRERRLLRRTRPRNGHTVSEYLVCVGRDEERQTWRLIVHEHDGKTFELVTTVLNPRHLSAWAAIRLYRARWTIERVLAEIKCDLRLCRIHASRPFSIAHQVYGAVMTHAVLRRIQSEMAAEMGAPPEEISFHKLLAAVRDLLVTVSLHERLCQWVQRHRRLPTAEEFLGMIDSRTLLVEHRKEKTEDERSAQKTKDSRKWISMANIPGLSEIIQMAEAN